MRIIIGYATVHGSTMRIAERIAQQLRKLGHTVDVIDLAASHPSRALNSCDCLILGSAIHNGQWLAAAEEAVDDLLVRNALREVSVWTFSVSSVGDTSTFVSPRLARLIRRHSPEPIAFALLHNLSDVQGHRGFAGAIAPGDWPGFGRLVFRLMGGRYGEAFDWDDIDRWSAHIANTLAVHR